MTAILSEPPIVNLLAYKKEREAKIQASIFSTLVSTKFWDNMTRTEREFCVQHIVSTATTKEEVCSKLSWIGLSIDKDAIEWTEIDFRNPEDLSSFLFIKEHGGLVSANAIVAIEIYAELF